MKALFADLDDDLRPDVDNPDIIDSLSADMNEELRHTLEVLDLLDPTRM